jgi:hypothetical protein
VSRTELVEGPSAGRFDFWRRVLNVGSIAVPVVVGLLLSALGVPGPVLAGVMIVLFVALFIASLVAGQRMTRTMRRELEAGYSTLFDVVDYEYRDARTLELLRADNVPPVPPENRSLLRSMLTVKPGTMLAKRIEEDEKRMGDDNPKQ